MSAELCLQICLTKLNEFVSENWRRRCGMVITNIVLLFSYGFSIQWWE